MMDGMAFNGWHGMVLRSLAWPLVEMTLASQGMTVAFRVCHFHSG